MALLTFTSLPGRALTILAVCTVSLNGCKKETEATPEVAVSVQVAHPTVGPIAPEISADAILAPVSAAALQARITAPIRAYYVQRGARVHKGQLLAVLEDRDLQANALDTKGSLLTAEAAYSVTTHATVPEAVQKAQLDVDEAQANLVVADRTANERKRLLAQGAISGREVDTSVAAEVQAQATYDMATKHLQVVRETTRASDLQSAEGQLTSAKGKYQNAAAQVSFAELRSPIAGVVTERPFFAGETAAAGTPVLTVMDTSSLIAKLHVAQATAQELRLGGSAEVHVPGVIEPVTAKVALISPALDPGSTTVEVWLKLANPDGTLKVGTPVHVVIAGHSVTNALQIPIAALLPAQDGSTTVMVMSADSVAHKRAVVAGIRTAESVQILSGLAAGDNVIVDGSYGLDDGTKVVAGKAKAGAEDKD